MTSIELLRKLLQFERLGKKLARQKGGYRVNQTIDYNNRSFMNNSSLNAPPSMLDDTIFQSNIDRAGINSTLQPQNMNSSIDAGLQEGVKQELDSFVHKRNQTLLMKISQDRVKQQYQETQKLVKKLMKANSVKDQQLLTYKSQFDLKGVEIEALQKKTVLLISHLQKQVFEELSQQAPEKEPYQGPLRDLLRNGFNKDCATKQKTPSSGKKKSPMTLNKYSSASVSPKREESNTTLLSLAMPPQVQSIVDEPGLMPKIVEEEHLDELDDKRKLKLKILQLENQLRERSDYVLSTGERMELVIDYKKYEATKMDQFQELIKKVKLGQRMSNQREVDQLLRDRRAFQLEAYRLSKFMQQRINDAVKQEAFHLFNSAPEDAAQ